MSDFSLIYCNRNYKQNTNFRCSHNFVLVAVSDFGAILIICLSVQIYDDGWKTRRTISS